MKHAILILAVLALLTPSISSSAAAKPSQPNIVWITAEDMSPNLGCYGDPFAQTPRLDKFATESVRYTQAFATAPVCSPARSCLITGVYATSLGTQRLRSEFPIPKEIRGFATYLRDAGYYTCNNVKTDYNIAQEADFIRQNWNESSPTAHWRNRPKGKPFFAVFNLMTTHQSRTGVWPWEEFEALAGKHLSEGERSNPEQVPVPPFYPDTPTVRKCMARYYDCIAIMDKQVGALLDQLEEDGLADNTLVFFYSDHGMGMPRGKRLLHDSGMHVPLMIRFPQSLRQWAPALPGSTTERLVSFVDFPPTVLSLAGLPIPDYMQGKPFLGPLATAPRQFVFGARDRVDEAFDLSRSVRGGRFLYIKNYMPHLSWMQPEWFSDQAEIRQHLFDLRAAGELGDDQLTYAAETKPVEELYDTASDPHQLNNLVDHAHYQHKLKTLRQALHSWQDETRDLGFTMEPELWAAVQSSGATPYQLRKDETLYPLQEIRTVTQAVGSTNITPSVRGLQLDSALTRYWAAVGLHSANPKTGAARELLRNRLDDPSPSVRIEAAAALLKGRLDEAALNTLLAPLKDRTRPEATLHAVRSLQLAELRSPEIDKALREVYEYGKAHESEHPCWMFVWFSADAALNSKAR